MREPMTMPIIPGLNGRWTFTNPRIRGWRRWITAFFGNYRWCRRVFGGHWERWWVGSCCSFIWLDTDRCSITEGTRPPDCFGTPTCEHFS